MKAEQLFSVANLTVMIGWLVLIIAPRWVLTRKIVLSGAIVLLSSVAYLILIVLFFGRIEGSFSSLDGVMKLFTNEWMVLAGWIHYLAFDLFVGVWEVKDAQAKEIPHWLVIPCLIFTFLLGPIGYLLYSLLRVFWTKREVKNDKKTV